MESSVHSSIHLACHLQNIYANLYLKVYYPPPCKRDIWHYKKTNVDLIQRVIGKFKWERTFHKKNTDDEVVHS